MRASVAAATLAVVVVTTLAAPIAGAQQGDPLDVMDDFPLDQTLGPVEIMSFDATFDLTTDGTLNVVEDITVRYNSSRRGIYRYIPVVYDLQGPVWFDLPEGTVDDWQRLLDVDQLSVTSETAPDAIKVTRPDRFGTTRDVSIRVGDEDTYITGVHHYRISYVVRGALNATDAGTELYWNVTGNGWDMPMRRASATFRGPGLDTGRFACFEGGNYSSLPCDARAVDGRVVMETGFLDAYTGMTGVVVFDPDVVPAPEPILRQRWTPLRALWGSDWAIPLAVLVGLGAIGGVIALMWRQGRDRVLRSGLTVDSRLDSVASEGLRPLRDATPVAVEYRPPDDLRPAELGLIIDERVDPVDVSATVVDLAVRGYLTVEEVDKKRLLVFSTTDWKLKKVDRDRNDLMEFERLLVDGLFEDGDEVLVGDLKGKFADDYGKVQRAVYEQGRKRRWFNGRPDKQRSKWLGIGIAAEFVAFGLLVVLFIFTQVAVVGVPLVLAASMLAFGHRWMPHRTAAGSDVLRRTLGFREFIEAAEADRMQFAERENLFVDYLPYAVVFGATEKWAKTFADLGVDTAAAVGGFWVGSHYGDTFDAGRFSDGLSNFSNSIGTSLSTVPSSSGGSGFSGGGFSGGGMGGGGGGSW